MSTQRVLILGGGFAGLTLARSLERITTAAEIDVTLVSRENFTLFTPMLPEICSGSIEPRHIVTPLRAALKRTSFVLGEVVGIDLPGRCVELQFPGRQTAEILRYDHLVIALGGVTSTFGLPGVAERAFPFKTLNDAEALRNEIISNLELAHASADERERKRLLTFAIIGGGFTGVEVAGEMVEFLHGVRSFYPCAERDSNVVIVEGGERLLPELPAAMGYYTQRNLAKRGVDIRLGRGVREATDAGIVLSDGSTISTATIVWSAGVRPAPLIAELPTAHTKNGAIAVEPDFSVPGHPGIWALGDCAAVPMTAGGYYPPTAQHAIREGEVLARNIAATVRSRATEPFRFASLGSMASLGAQRGVALLPGGLLVTGFAAWFIWRTYYLSRLPGWDRRSRVAFDWTAGLLFSRDIASIRFSAEHA
jgi:NADH dehydrogenase